MDTGPFIKIASWMTVLGLVSFQMLKERPVSQPDGVLTPDAPEQTALSGKATNAFALGKWRFAPVASFSMHARVLAAEDYFFDDYSGVSRGDVVVGWGAMSDNIPLKNVSVSTGDRFWAVEKTGGALTLADIRSQMAHLHLLHANEAIRDVITELKPGHLVRVKGLLVNGTTADLGDWKTSLERTDNGPGSSEILYVTNIIVYGPHDDDGRARIVMSAKREPREVTSGNRFRGRLPPGPGGDDDGSDSGDGGDGSGQDNQNPGGTARAVPTAAVDADGVVDLAARYGSRSSDLEIEQRRLAAAFLEGANVSAAGSRGAVINGQTWLLDRVDLDTGLRLVAITSRRLVFEDTSGRVFEKVWNEPETETANGAVRISAPK